jgi:signal transduction histidine kinase
MTLANRLSVFFLGAMAVILAASSAAVYFLVRYQLTQQFDRQLNQVRDTLVAAVEVEDDDVKWEPADHTIALENAEDSEGIWWCVLAPDGAFVDRSAQWGPDDATSDELLAAAKALPNGDRVEMKAAGWRILASRLAAPKPKPVAERDAQEFDRLLVVAARPMMELQSTLRAVALASTILPIIVWALFALVGRWLCVQALKPLAVMAHDARGMSGADVRLRLTVPPSRDELHDLGSAFNGLLDRLNLSFERQQAFVGNAAHQLRTPLTALKGQIEVALRRPRESQEYVDVLRRAEHESSELNRILESLLFLARTAQSIGADAGERIALADWLPRYAEKWREPPRWNDLRFEAAAGATLLAPPKLLEQLLDNLIGNAIKYSAAGSAVTCRADIRDGRTLITVEDAGIGISAADQRQIFQPFFRAEAARRTGMPGDGLGLATANQIAQALGGRLMCASQEGTGSRFTLEVEAA